MHLKRKFTAGAAVLTLGASIAAALAMPASADFTIPAAGLFAS